MKSYSAEYLGRLQSRGWRRLRTFCFALTWGRCAVFPFLPARDLDHLHYRNLGKEQPMRDVVPLSRFVHRSIVTPFRARFGRRLINPVLQAAFAFWIAVDVAFIAFLVHLVIRYASPVYR